VHFERTGAISGELIFGGAAVTVSGCSRLVDCCGVTYQTSPKAPMPTGELSVSCLGSLFHCCWRETPDVVLPSEAPARPTTTARREAVAMCLCGLVRRRWRGELRTKGVRQLPEVWPGSLLAAGKGSHPHPHSALRGARSNPGTPAASWI
jgi:hypothetical protein